MLEMIVIFAHWCPTCNMMLPIVEGIESDYKGKIQMVWIDVEQNPEVIEKYGIEIVPTFILQKKKMEVARMAGMIGENILRERIKNTCISWQSVI